MLRKYLLATAAAIAALGPALAADLPLPPPPPPPVPIFTWTGIYAGAQIGYTWARDNTNFTTLDPDRPFFPANTAPSGVIGGAHIGYNLQINQWLLGLEGSVDGTSKRQSIFQAGTPGFLHAVHPDLTVRTGADIEGSIRLRLGVAWNQLLIYATGGVAFAGLRNDYTLGPFLLTESISRTRAGWTVGGGIQYALTNNWSARVEYRYSDFGSYNDFPFAILASLPIARHTLTQNQVQVGVSYKFDPFLAAPVVAKY